MMFNPKIDTRKYDSVSSSLTNEPVKQQESTILQQNQKLLENPRALLLLLHQRDLEIKGLKRAAQKDPSDRLSCILRELVRSRRKASLMKNEMKSNENALQKEVDQLNAELTAVKKDHKQEMQQLGDKLMKSKLHILQLQETVRTLSAKSEEKTDSESSMSQDEGTKLACECFELWSETGSKITSNTSDLRLRRIPKHTSFVDAFHKFGSVSLSQQEKDEIITKLETVAGKAHLYSIIDESSQESSRTESHLPSLQSSVVALTSQQSDLSSSITETKMTESSSSLPSLQEKIQQTKSICMFLPLGPWRLAQSGLPLGLPSDGQGWTHDVPSPFIEKCKWCHSGTGSLRIVSVHRAGLFVRIFNSLLNKEVDLSGYIIQQWVGGYPVSIYHFPNGTILPAQHHITVWASGASLAHEHPTDKLSGPRYFRAGPECITILRDHNGQIVSQYRNPHQVTTAAVAYNDNVDLSVDKFPLNSNDDDTDAAAADERHNQPKLPSRKSLSSHNHKKDRESAILMKRRYTRQFSVDSVTSSKMPNDLGAKKRTRDSSTSSGSFLFPTKSLSPVLVKASPSSSSDEEHFALQSWETQYEEPETREFRTTLDTTFPMVSLIGQKSARSKYGFKYMTYLPTTTNLHLRRYCPAK